MNTWEPIEWVRQYSTSKTYRERVASRIWLSLAPAAQWSNLLLIPEFCPGGRKLTCGPTLSTNQMRPWD